MYALTDKTLKKCDDNLMSDRLRDSRFLRHDLAVFPHIDRRAVHLGGFSSCLGCSAECPSDALYKPRALRLPLCLHVTLSSSCGAGPVGRPRSRSASDWLLIIHFDGEAKIFDHAPDFRSWCAWSREVPVHKDGVGRVEGKGL